MSYDDATLRKLEALASAGDRTAYYEALIKLGDPYGAMALGVVKQSNLAGRVARSYAISVASRYCRPIDDGKWLEISNNLMRVDMVARRVEDNFEPNSPSLTWKTIRDYHVAVFRDIANLPPETWTAWIPLQIVGEAKGQSLWHRMLAEDFLTVAVQTVWLVSGRLTHDPATARDMQMKLIPQLQYNPPVAGGPAPDPALAACLVRAAPYQLLGTDRTDNRRLAAFYLSVLATNPALLGRLLLIAPTTAWRNRPYLINPAY